jgi:tRNA dimethylallyltransferase
MRWENKRLIVVVGPTAVGKTALAIHLAEHFHTEVISADSRQIFKELTIGTAKPDDAELRRVPHHFINSHSIQEVYDAAQYGKDVLERIHSLFEKYDYLILCGGSGLYLKAALEGFDDIPAIPDETRDELVAQFEQHGIGWLQQKMEQLDPDHLKTIDRNNPHRLIRALEVKITTGMSIASFQTRPKLEHPFQIVKVGLELPREELYSRIDRRMDAMISLGLFEEAKKLYGFRNHNALQTVGYQEIFAYLKGQYDWAEAVRLLKRNSRRYAKRQLTWFKRDESIQWFHPEQIDAVVARCSGG